MITTLGASSVLCAPGTHIVWLKPGMLVTNIRQTKLDLLISVKEHEFIKHDTECVVFWSDKNVDEV